jgi:hypothetical protein
MTRSPHVLGSLKHIDDLLVGVFLVEHQLRGILAEISAT